MDGWQGFGEDSKWKMTSEGLVWAGCATLSECLKHALVKACGRQASCLWIRHGEGNFAEAGRTPDYNRSPHSAGPDLFGSCRLDHGHVLTEGVSELLHELKA